VAAEKAKEAVGARPTRQHPAAPGTPRHPGTTPAPPRHHPGTTPAPPRQPGNPTRHHPATRQPVGAGSKKMGYGGGGGGGVNVTVIRIYQQKE
jgi:hypothetical protein